MRMKYLAALLLSTASLQAYAQKHDVPATTEFRITGSVKKELTFHIDDFSAYQIDSLGNVVIRNKKGEEKALVKNLKGILLKTILDSARITADKHKDYSELVVVLTASDGYKNVYSWNEVFNTEVGNHVYIVTEMDGKPMGQMPDRILVLSLADINSGMRHLKGLAKIEVRKAE